MKKIVMLSLMSLSSVLIHASYESSINKIAAVCQEGDNLRKKMHETWLEEQKKKKSNFDFNTQPSSSAIKQGERQVRKGVTFDNGKNN